MNNLPASVLNENLSECLDCLRYFEKNYEPCNTKCVVQFKKFLHCLFSCLYHLRKNDTLRCNLVCKDKILLCISQIIKTLTIFKNILSNHHISRQIMWYLCERLQWCISEMTRVLSGSASDSDSTSDSLHHCVASAVEQLNTNHLPPQIIHRLISQAITIAKVSSPNDYSEITSVCQNILQQTCTFNEDVNETTDISLLKDSLSASLSSLELRVNVAVLRIFLQVYSEPSEPVKQLVRNCQQAEQPRHAADLSDFAQQLDAQIDRITLVTQFAISCCKNIKEVNNMRCCIASVESVDNYLLPAITAFYLSLNPLDQDFVQLLCDHLQEQLSSLHGSLDAVIDSYTFSKVVLEDIRSLCGKISGGELKKTTCSIIVKHAWLLYKHLVKTTTNKGVLLVQLKKDIHECQAAIDKNILLTAVLKRVQHLIIAIDNICIWLSSSSDTHETVNEDEKNKSLAPDHEKIIRKECHKPDTTEGSIKISTCFDTNKSIKKLDLKLLSPYLNSSTPGSRTLYLRTPRKEVKPTIMYSNCSTLSSSFSTSNDELNLEITNILESLSTMADTLPSEKMLDICDKLEQASVVNHGSSSTSCPVSEVDTLERLQDIKYLDEKLEALRFN